MAVIASHEKLKHVNTVMMKSNKFQADLKKSWSQESSIKRIIRCDIYRVDQKKVRAELFICFIVGVYCCFIQAPSLNDD